MPETSYMKGTSVQISKDGLLPISDHVLLVLRSLSNFEILISKFERKKI